MLSQIRERSLAGKRLDRAEGHWLTRLHAFVGQTRC